ncbi:hypothetical protein DFH09DRAFT_832865, partial [Mycena vulgaris]
ITQPPSAAERAQIIDWLSPINFFLRHADISGARQLGTGEWLLADPHFKEWESSSGGTLWCRGIPGAGKTVLASIVVDHLSAQTQQTAARVACVYLNHKEAVVQTPFNLLSGLWRQLVLGRTITPLAKKLYQQHLEKHTLPSLDEMRDVLRSEIAGSAKVYIVIDAVDEYPEDSRRILLGSLAVMGSAVNMMLTSRPHITPDTSLPNLKALELRANDDDVRKYLDAHIQMSSRLSKHVQTRPELREEIHSKIRSSVDGMFLLAKLHIESLSAKSTIKAVREALKNLPKNLNDTYKNTMQRIDDQNGEDRRIARSALIWVANAKRPLAVSEIRVALAVEPGAKQLDEDNLLDIEIILAVCAGMVIVDDKLSVVRLVHYTTQEFLDRIQPQQFPHAQTEITRTLLTFLAFDEFAAASWTSDDTPPPSYRIFPILPDACCWCATGAAQDHDSSYYGYLAIVQLLIENGPDVNSYDDGGYSWPLHAAACGGSLKVARFLLQSGAAVNSQGTSYTSALAAASHRGHESIVQLLIENGADINRASAGHENIVQLLLTYGADVNMKGGNYGHPLQAACYGRYPSIIRLLMQNGADVNARGGTYDNPLQAVCYVGDAASVQLLIEYGA